jgi:Protein of unknown function (DUF3168)
VNASRQAIYARLAGDEILNSLLSAPGAIYHAVAPAAAVAPFVTFNKQAGTPSWQFAGARLQDDLWLVKAIDLNTSATRAEDIAAHIDSVLNDAPLTAPLSISGGVSVVAIYRQSDVSFMETNGDDEYRHEGAVYRLVTQPA